MCGIAGFHLSFSPEKKVELLHAITQRLHHRGPDASGIYMDDNMCLAHTRLKIIDLSDEANQPFSYEDDRVVLVFNGEIYNYADLRSELLHQGHHFRTKSDTEVIAAAYACWGISCLEKLDGMFALGIYDRVQKKVILARDVFGKKPLYYSRKDGLSFASELSAFPLLYPDLALEPAAINHYLSLGYILHPLTPYQDVFLLPPASYAEYDLTTSSFSTSTYFSYADCFRNKFVADTTTIIDSTLSLLNEAVSKRLIGDVPYGIFSAVVWIHPELRLFAGSRCKKMCHAILQALLPLLTTNRLPLPAPLPTWGTLIIRLASTQWMNIRSGTL